MESFTSVRKLPLADAAAIMRQRLQREASQSFYTSNDFEEGRNGLWASEVEPIRRSDARAREELAKLNVEEGFF